MMKNKNSFSKVGIGTQRLKRVVGRPKKTSLIQQVPLNIEKKPVGRPKKEIIEETGDITGKIRIQIDSKTSIFVSSNNKGKIKKIREKFNKIRIFAEDNEFNDLD